MEVAWNWVGVTALGWGIMVFKCLELNNLAELFNFQTDVLFMFYVKKNVHNKIKIFYIKNLFLWIIYSIACVEKPLE